MVTAEGAALTWWLPQGSAVCERASRGRRAWGRARCDSDTGRAGGAQQRCSPRRSLRRAAPAGLSSGMVLVFDIPPKGTDIAVSEVLKEHRDAITDIAAELGQAPVRA